MSLHFGHHNLRLLWPIGVIIMLILAAAFPDTQDSVLANGATIPVVTNRSAGPYELEVGILPGSPKVGNLHLSIVVRDEAQDRVITDAIVKVTATGPEGATNVGPVAALNPLQSPHFYEVNIPLDLEGGWTLALDVDSDLGPAGLEIPLNVTKSGGISLAFIAAIAIVVLATAIWIWGRVSNRRRRRRKRQGVNK